jgi:hypothetical protein
MDDDRDRDLRVARRGTGFAAWGPGFYVWEEDVSELLRSAGALARAGSSRRAEPPVPEEGQA